MFGDNRVIKHHTQFSLPHKATFVFFGSPSFALISTPPHLQGRLFAVFALRPDPAQLPTLTPSERAPLSAAPHACPYHAPMSLSIHHTLVTRPRKRKGKKESEREGGEKRAEEADERRRIKERNRGLYTDAVSVGRTCCIQIP